MHKKEYTPQKGMERNSICKYKKPKTRDTPQKTHAREGEKSTKNTKTKQQKNCPQHKGSRSKTKIFLRRTQKGRNEHKKRGKTKTPAKAALTTEQVITTNYTKTAPQHKGSRLKTNNSLRRTQKEINEHEKRGKHKTKTPAKSRADGRADDYHRICKTDRPKHVGGRPEKAVWPTRDRKTKMQKSHLSNNNTRTSSATCAHARRTTPSTRQKGSAKKQSRLTPGYRGLVPLSIPPWEGHRKEQSKNKTTIKLYVTKPTIFIPRGNHVSTVENTSKHKQ